MPQAEQLKAKAPAAIISVKARQVFDSRGNPTVEAEVKTHKVRRAAGAAAGACFPGWLHSADGSSIPALATPSPCMR